METIYEALSNTIAIIQVAQGKMPSDIHLASEELIWNCITRIQTIRTNHLLGAPNEET